MAEEWKPPASDKVEAFVPPAEDRVTTTTIEAPPPLTEEEKIAAVQAELDRTNLPAGAGMLAGQPKGGVPVPRIIKDAALEGGGGTAGQVIGAFGGPFAPITVPLGGAIGGGLGNYAAQRLRVNAGEQDKIRIGELMGAIGTNAIPGLSLETAGAKGLIREGVKQGAAGLGRNVLQTGVDEGRLPTPTSAVLSTVLPAAGGVVAQKIGSMNPEVQAALKAAEAAKTVEQKTFEAGKALGLKTSNEAGKPPAVVANLLSSKNRDKINAAVVEELGLPKNTEITPDVLDDIRQTESAPYAEIEKISKAAAAKKAAIEKERYTATDPHDLAIQKSDPKTVAELAPLEVQAAADIDGLRKARKAATTGFRGYKTTGDPKTLQAAEDALELADKLESQIDSAAIAAGKPELAKQLAASRTRIAKTYDVEKALNLGNADVSVPALLRAKKAGRPLSGNLETLANYGAAFPFAVKEGATTMAPGVTRTEGMVALLALAQKNKLAALLPLAGTLKRQAELSDLYQAMFPRYPVPTLDASVIPAEARAAQLFSQAAGASAADQN